LTDYGVLESLGFWVVESLDLLNGTERGRIGEAEKRPKEMLNVEF